MDNISNIIVPFDFSSSAITALDYAINFIENHKIKIHLVNISDEPEIEKIRKAFDDICKTYEDRLELPLRWVWGYGALIETLNEVQEDKRIDLIIMGTSGLFKKGETTNTSKFVAKANCPVLVVPEDTKKYNIKNICLGLGENEIDEPKMLSILLEIAQKFNAKVHVLTIENEEKVYGYSESDEKNDNTIMYYLENFYSDHTFVENPDIVKGIFSYVDNHDIDLITILPRNNAKYNNPSKGELTRELVLQTKVPVLVLEY